MKMYNKSDLSLIDGLLVSPDGDVIAVDPKVVEQANNLETMLQQGIYLAMQPEFTPAPSLDNFKRESIDDTLMDSMKFTADTPNLDAKARETMVLMDEIDDREAVNRANDLLAQFTDLVAFVEKDKILSCDGIAPMKFDMPRLGSVLNLTKERIIEAVALIAGLQRDDGMPDVKCISPEDMTEEERKALLAIVLNHDPKAKEMYDKAHANEVPEGTDEATDED